MLCISMSQHTMHSRYQTVVIKKESQKRALQVLLRQQKKVAHSLSLLGEYNEQSSVFAWKTVKALEQKISELNIDINELNKENNSKLHIDFD